MVFVNMLTASPVIVMLSIGMFGEGDRERTSLVGFLRRMHPAHLASCSAASIGALGSIDRRDGHGTPHVTLVAS